MDTIPSSETVDNMSFLLTALKTATYKSVPEAFTNKVFLTKIFIINMSFE
jgi:hypothetical protein